MMFFAQISNGQTKSIYQCLPKGITPETVVSATFANKPELSKRVFVKDELKRLKARCLNKKLVDFNKREIRFHKLHNCFGVQPPDFIGIIGKEQQTLAELRKKYTVITLTSMPSGRPCERARPNSNWRQ